MIKTFYVSNFDGKASQCDLHNEDCYYLPNALQREYLGIFKNSKNAASKARESFANINICKYCCRDYFVEK